MDPMTTNIGMPADPNHSFNWWESGVVTGYPICPSMETFYRVTFQNPLSNWKVMMSDPQVSCPTPPHGMLMSMNLKFGNFADASVQSQADVTYSMA
jgi:hypothetical protein